MASFKDKHGREWTIVIDPWGIKQVLARTGFHLGKLFENKMAKYMELGSDPVLLVDVIFVLCSEQAEKAKVTDEQFGRSLDGDTFEAMVAAFEEAVSDFCPSHLRRIMKATRAKVAAGMEKTETEAMILLEKLDVFSPSATNSAESSESIRSG